MAELRQRGIDLLLNVQSAREHADDLTQQEVQALLKETEQVLSLLLESAASADERAAGEPGDTKRPRAR